MAVTTVAGKIYAVGGWVSGVAVDTVEVYDPATNKWTSCASLPAARAEAAAVALDGLVYVVGGNGAVDCAVYDPATDTWSSKAEMSTVREGAGAVVLGGKIYVMGGCDGYQYLSSVEEYDPASNSWRVLASGLLTARANYVAGVLNGEPYLVGGYSGSDFLSTVLLSTMERGESRSHFSIIGASSATAGSSVTFTVTALTPDNATDTSYTGTVHFTSTDPNAVLPADASLTNGVGTFTVTFETAGGQLLTATDTVLSGITGTTGITGGTTIDVSAATATHYVLGVWSNPVVDSNFTYSVTATDDYGNTDTSYGGTVHFTSTDDDAVLPADATLTSGVATFIAVFETAGSHSLTATDTVNAGITGSSVVTVVTGLPTSTSLAVSTTSGAVGDAITLTATIEAVSPSTATPDGGTVVFMDGDVTLGSASVSGGTATLVVTSLTAGSHLLTATYNGFGTGYADSQSGVGSDSLITTIAGNGSSTYGGDDGAATAATLYQPQGVAVDGSGNIYIADSYNNRIRKVRNVSRGLRQLRYGISVLR